MVSIIPADSKLNIGDPGNRDPLDILTDIQQHLISQIEELIVFEGETETNMNAVTKTAVKQRKDFMTKR